MDNKAAVKVFGVGGGGINILEKLQKHLNTGIAYIGVNSDHTRLKVFSGKRIFLSEKLAGCRPETARVLTPGDNEKIQLEVAGARRAGNN